MRAIAEIRPSSLGLENVPGFADSTMAREFKEVLVSAGYRYAECELCPTQLGIPNRRRRYFLIASLQSQPSFPKLQPCPAALKEFINADLTNAERQDSLHSDDIAQKYAGAIDIVSTSDPQAITACFTSAYGKSPIRSGSYLEQDGRLRRFSPREILNLLGFPRDFHVPQRLTQRQQWKLVGNSVSVWAVEHCLKRLA